MRIWIGLASMEHPSMPTSSALFSETLPTQKSSAITISSEKSMNLLSLLQDGSRVGQLITVRFFFVKTTVSNQSSTSVTPNKSTIKTPENSPMQNHSANSPGNRCEQLLEMNGCLVYMRHLIRLPQKKHRN